jgi:hypothetical protein
MEAITKKTNGSIPLAGNAGTPANDQVSQRDQYNLSLNFIGTDPDGRYVFRYKAAPLNTIVGDREDFREWMAAHERQRARTIQPVIDAGLCTACHAVRICAAIVPDGKWNPYGGKGVKPCPGVLK